MNYLYIVALLTYACLANAHPVSPYRFIPPQYELSPVPLNSVSDFGLFYDAIEDEEGFIWLSSNKGIYAYDGYHLTGYTNRDKAYPLRSDSSQEYLGTWTSAPSGLLYVQGTTSYRILCFDPVKRKLQYELAAPELRKNGGLYGLSISDKGEILTLEINNSKNTYTIRKKEGNKRGKPVYSNHLQIALWTSFLFGAGNHWFANNNYIIRIASGSQTVKTYSLPDSSTITVYADAAHIFFLDNKHHNIYTWDKTTDQIVLYMHLPLLLDVRSEKLKFAIKNDKVYLGSNQGFYLINKADKTIQDLSAMYAHTIKNQNPDGVAAELNKILITRDNNIYLIRQTSIYQLKKKPPVAGSFLEHIKVPTPPVAFSFRGLAEDEHKNVYASYYYGLVVKPAGTDCFVEPPLFRKLAQKANGTFGLHCWKEQLFWNNASIDLRTGRYHFLGDQNPSIIHTTQHLNKDTLWFYPWWSAALYCFDLKRQQLHPIPIDPRLSYANERNIQELNDITGDASGQNLWLATGWNGIALITKQGKLLKKYEGESLGLKKGDINAIYALQLSSQGLWFGCSNGLGILDPASGKTNLYVNPLDNGNQVASNRAIFSILPDTAGNFYLGSSRGIVYFDTKERIFYNLAEDHPLGKIECNRASAFRSSDNKYYFGSTDGLYSFFPQELQFSRSSVSTRPLKLYNITIYDSYTKQYRYLGASLDPGQMISLSPSEGDIAFNFSVPEFSRNVYYCYRIKGQSELWTPYSLDNKVLLYNLQPGKYILEIKTSTDQSDHNARIYQLPIVMLQVWYKRAWVLALFFLVAIAVATLITRNWARQKLKKQKELATLRTRISMDLHDDVGSLLSGLAMQTDLLSHTAGHGQKKLFREIGNLSRDAMEQMRDIVWSLDNRKDKYENLVDRMKVFAASSLSAKNITYELVVNGIQGHQLIKQEKRQTVYLIFKEALTNIVRHSDAKNVVITLASHKKGVLLTIRDNGSKIPETITDGMGLSNMKARAERINAILTIRFDKGFIITLNIP